jgi:hypothetical protein
VPDVALTGQRGHIDPFRQATGDEDHRAGAGVWGSSPRFDG